MDLTNKAINNYYKMDLKYLLINLTCDWADEFDVKALWVTDEETFNKWKKELFKKDICEHVEIYYGTNEWITFSSYEDIMINLEVIEIDSVFYNKFIEYIGEEYGLINLSSLSEYYNDLEE